MKNTKIKSLEIGAASAAVLAGAAAGVYMLADKKSKKKAKVWFGKLQKDVLKELSKANKNSKEVYHKAIDNAAKQYSAVKDIDKQDLAVSVKQLKGHWDVIKSEIQKAAKDVKKIKSASKVKKGGLSKSGKTVKRVKKTVKK